MTDDRAENDDGPAHNDGGGPPSGPRAWLKIGPAETKTISGVACLVGVASGVSQYVQPYTRNGLASFGVSLAISVAGGLLIVALVRLFMRRRRKITITLLPAVGGLILAGAIGGAIGHVVPGSGSPPRASAASAATTPSSSSPAAPTPTGAVTEIADNRNGVAVFADPTGAAVDAPRIPFATHVQVACVAPNESGIVSINAFYLIETPPWKGVYAPADTFANGDSVGAPGSTNIDPAVTPCPGT
jgi:hypothetical protein